MEAKLRTVRDLLRGNKRYLVPVYQRGYVWNQKEQWQPLWEDIEDGAKKRIDSDDTELHPHFIGATVVEEKPSKREDVADVFNIIDGQQRLLTIQIILAALHKHAVELGFDAVANGISNYMFNKDLDEQQRLKVFPNKRRNGEDRQLFTDILSMSMSDLYSTSMSDLNSPYYRFFKSKGGHGINYRTSQGERVYDHQNLNAPRLLAALGFFLHKIEGFVAEHHAQFNGSDKANKIECFNALLNTVLYGLSVAQISLVEEDQAQIIFETVNARGAPLLQVDLIKNDIFRRAGGENAEDLFGKYWTVFEKPFWERETGTRRHKRIMLDDYFRCFIESQTGKSVDPNHLFKEYKKYIGSKTDSKSVETELDDLVEYGKIYARLHSDSPEFFGGLVKDIQSLNVTTLHPLVLSLWGDANKHEEEEKKKCLTYLVSFIARRAVCGLTDKGYNNYFLDIIRLMNQKKENNEADFWSSDSFISIMNESTGESRKFPSDSEFNLCFTKLRAKDKQDYILARIEMYQDPKCSWQTIAEKQVEHILPRVWTEHWPLQDGSRVAEWQLYDARYRHEGDYSPDTTWGQINLRNRFLEAIGNLTLLDRYAKNEARNKPFGEKIEIYPKDDPFLKITEDVMGYSEWNEEAIAKRGEWLFSIAKNIWPELPS